MVPDQPPARVTPSSCPGYSDFNDDTLAFSETLPWFKGGLMIAVGARLLAWASCLVAGYIWNPCLSTHRFEDRFKIRNHSARVDEVFNLFWRLDSKVRLECNEEQLSMNVDSPPRRSTIKVKMTKARLTSSATGKSAGSRTGDTSRLLAYTVVVLFLLQFSYATLAIGSTTVRATDLPAKVAINKDAGRGGHLMVMLRLESGEELPFEVDTGSPVTILDQSLQHKLGHRLGTMPIWNVSGDKQTSGIFKTIKLYLGKTQLITSDHIQCYDFKQHPLGILGMDCLRHYCIQLDFEAGEMRFLKPDQVQKPTVDHGKAFSLTFRDGKPFVRHGNFLGNNSDLLVDLGCNIDGLTQIGTNLFEGVYMPTCRWEGERYSDLIIASPGNTEALGLRFLARHLVTLDFPGHTLYLKRTDNVSSDDVGNSPEESARMSGLNFLLSRARKAQLPGWPVGDEEPIYFRNRASLDSQVVSFRFREADSFSVTSYEISRTIEDNAWRLLKARKVYQDGRTNEVLLIP